MKSWPLLGALMLLALASPAAAQVPGLPTTPAPPAAPGVPGATTPAVPGATTAPAGADRVTTIWDKLGLSKQGCKECKECIRECRDECCKTPFGQLINNFTKPLTLVSGGLMPPLCPPVPSDAELAKLLDPNSKASPAEIAAAKIKQDEQQAAARRAATKYLGTVDCHYYPEAEKALIASLRTDRIECVRLEAALALAKGCCCTRKTIEALTLVVNGQDTDGNPAETSDRVKAVALVALQRCLSVPESPREPPVPPERPPEPPELPPGTVKPGVVQAAFPLQARTPTMEQLVNGAARTMAENIGLSTPPRTPPTGGRNLFNLVTQAAAPRPVAEIGFDEEALLPPVHHPLPPPITPAPVTPAPAPPPVQQVQPAQPMPQPVQAAPQPTLPALPPLSPAVAPAPPSSAPVGLVGGTTVIRPN